jgi:glyoxylase-like metal-dependent hydrolase (beta-lactamase superfamily II)
MTMTAIAATDTDLRWDVLAIKRPGLTRDLPPDKEELMWVANSSTLIYGARDAILVDTLLTTEQSQTLVDWVVARGKNLTAIYVTHGHGDHFFGLASLLERFPRAKAVATPEVVRAMREHLSPARIDGYWRRLFPGEIPDRLLVSERLEGNDLELEGRKLIAVNAGRTDTTHSTCLYVPSIGTDRRRRRRLQRHPSLSWRDRHAEPARVDLHARRARGPEAERRDRRAQSAGKRR